MSVLAAYCGTASPTQRIPSQGGSSVYRSNFRPVALNLDQEDKGLVWTSATHRP